MKQMVSCTVNGESCEAVVDTRDTLLSLLRDKLNLTGAKEGCGNGNCGSCTVMFDGATMCACLVLASEADGASVTTIEGIADGNALHAVQSALIAHGGAQCGFCTPGVIVSAVALLQLNPAPDEAAIRHAIAGNICRCTGYDKIVEAIAAAAKSRAEERP